MFLSICLYIYLLSSSLPLDLWLPRFFCFWVSLFVKIGQTHYWMNSHTHNHTQAMWRAAVEVVEAELHDGSLEIPGHLLLPRAAAAVHLLWDTLLDGGAGLQTDRMQSCAKDLLDMLGLPAPP